MTTSFRSGFRALLLAAALSAATPAHAANVLRWASQGDALTLDPHAQNEGPTTSMNLNIMEPLVRNDDKLGFEPGLAVSWKVVEPTVWEFKLREGVTFHDGDTFDADDVMFSLDRARSGNSDFRTQIVSIEAVRKIDSHTVRIVTKGPNPILPNQLVTVAIMSKEWSEAHRVTVVQDYKNRQETFAVRNANGTGPFRLRLREPDVRTVLARNDAWWGWAGQPTNIDEIVYTPIANDATRVAALLSGELDFLLDPPLQDVPRIRATPGLGTKSATQNRVIFLSMDMGVPELRSSNVKGRNPFADVRVRRAVHQAVDVNAIRQKIMRDASEPTGLVVAPYVRGWTKDLDRRLPYDPEAAKALLAEAGYAEGFSVRLDCPNDRYINDEAICQAVAGMLGRIGIRVTLDAQTKSLHFPKVQKRASDFHLFGWGVPPLDSQAAFDMLYHTRAGWNVVGYSNPEMDRLIEAIRTELVPANRDELISQAWEIAKRDVVYVPLHRQVIVWAMRDRLDMPIIPNDMPQFRYARFK